ncbi:MAG: GGDEF domain-containing protein [Gallionella sp.]|jgi:diguanylate cyclase (GGDEF)-like protein
MIHSSEIVKVLESAPLFIGIPVHLLSQHLTGSQQHTLPSGQVLLAPNQPNKTIYIILSGRLRIQAKEAESDPIAILGQGECVGEMSMLGDAPVSAYVIAATDCTLLAIEHAVLWELINNSHAAAHNMLNMLTSRIRNTNQVAAESLEKQHGFSSKSMIDEVTGFYNQHWTREKFDRHLHRGILDKKPDCLLILEIDQFKEFSRRHGQLGSDQALRDVAHTILSCLRPNDQAGRHSDEKFAVFFPDTPLAYALTASERLKTAANHSLIVLPSGDALPSITLSIGISQVHSDDTLGSLFARADEALQSAKDCGGNCVKTVK